MLSISRRDCMLAVKATTDGKEDPDNGEQIKTLAFELDAVMLDATELNVLLSEPHAHGVLFNTGARPVEPYLKSLKSFELKSASEHAFVKIMFGLEEREFTFTDCKISKIKLSPQVGGETAMSCKVTAVPVLDESFAELFEQLGKPIEIEIRANPPGAQQDLPLNNFGEGEQPAAKPKRGGKGGGPRHVN